MNKIGGLGKGLGALFSESNLNVASEKNLNFNATHQGEEVVPLKISQIEPNRNQPRYCFDEHSIKSLSNSIKTNGLIQPIVVREMPSGKFEIVAGERRFRAFKLAGLKTIPAVVKNLTEDKSTELALIENLQRENLNPIEQAKGFLVLMKAHGLTQEEVAKRVGKSRSAVANIIRLLNLPEEIIVEVEKGNLSEGQARALLAADSIERMKKLAKKAIELKLSVRDLERLCSVKKLKKTPKVPVEDKNIYKQLEASIKAEINRNVKIEVVNGEKGRLSIDFYNRDDLVSMTQILANLRR